jgi:AraC-like DNA-binding protein
MYRDLYGFDLRRAGFSSWLEPPRPAVTLMIDLEGSIRADGERLPSAWVGGLGERPTLVGLGGSDYMSVDFELTPLGAYTVLGRPLADLAGACVALEDAFGRGGRELADRLREQRDWDARFDVLERFLIDHVAVGPAPTPAIAWADRRLRETGGNVRVGALAAELGCSRRYLTSRFSAEVGLGPKAVARQLRFAGVRERLERTPMRLAEIGPCRLLRPGPPQPGLPRAGRCHADRVRHAADPGRRRRRRRVVRTRSHFSKTRRRRPA